MTDIPLVYALSMILGFLGLLTLALYSCVRLLTAMLGSSRIRPLYFTLVVTVIYLVLMMYCRQEYPVLYRWLVYYLGFISFAFFTSVVFWAACALATLAGRPHWVKNPLAAGLFIASVAAVSAIAVINYEKPAAVVEHTLYSGKLTRSYRLLQLSDIQYGSITRHEMEQILQQAYDLQPDLIVFTGDLIDFERYSYDDFQKLAQSPVPIYFERGNHEFYHDPTRLLSYLQGIAPLRLLINDRAEFGELEIIGVDYSLEEGHLMRVLDQVPRDPRQFSILLYHEPKDVKEASTAGFDLQLYGHTHGGQIWPYTWLIDWMYEFGDGLFEHNGVTIYTSDGAALWGPRMRLGSQNEMVLFHLLPE